MTTLHELSAPLRQETNPTVFVGRLAAAANAAVDVAAPLRVFYVRHRRDPDGIAYTAHIDTPILRADGVSDGIVASMNRVAWVHLAHKLAIPVPYLDRIAGTFPALAEDTINTLADADERNALYRFWQADDGWMLRAVLSDRYQALDNVDALRAVTAGMTAADQSLADAEVSVDLTDRKFRLRVAVPSVSLAAPDLLSRYRWPFAAPDPTLPERPAPPVLWAGIEVINSETGHGRFTIAPRAVVQVCRNGLTRPVEFARAHIGAALDEGPVDWSAETRRRALDLVTAQVEDAVRTFCSVDYLRSVVDAMRVAAGLAVASAVGAVEAVQRRHDLSEAETRAVLDCFMRGGDSASRRRSLPPLNSSTTATGKARWRRCSGRSSSNRRRTSAGDVKRSARPRVRVAGRADRDRHDTTARFVAQALDESGAGRVSFGVTPVGRCVPAAGTRQAMAAAAPADHRSRRCLPRPTQGVMHKGGRGAGSVSPRDPLSSPALRVAGRTVCGGRGIWPRPTGVVPGRPLKARSVRRPSRSGEVRREGVLPKAPLCPRVSEPNPSGEVLARLTVGGL